MLLKCFYIFIYMAGFLKLCYCQRRTAPGVDSANGKKYVVYFVQSPFTKSDRDAWLCGGALVSPTQILTAAACLVEAENIYAIAGYTKYVDAKDIENDECTKVRKQRVVKILIPTEYKLAYENPAQWINVDVGVAIVEKPYNFSDLSYRTHCTYEPQPIFVNFENKYELESTHAVALGWGNVLSGNTAETNTQVLQESSTVIVDKTVCANTVNTQEIIYIIEKYLLCASNNVNDDNKDTKPETESTKDCTVRRYDLTRATDNNGCVEDDFGFRRNDNKGNNYTDGEEINRDMSLWNRTETRNNTNTDYLYTSLNSRRSSSLVTCQSGHGCPLIRWVGDKEVIIGVASNTNRNDDCKGPFLYVSTAATSKIIKCLLETNSMTRKFCNQEISDKRYEVQEIEISWPDIHTSPPVAMPLIKRSAPDEGPLVHRPTKDIVKDPPRQPGRSYDTSFQQPRAQSYDQPPEQTYNEAQSFHQPRTQVEERPYGIKLVPRNGQASEAQVKLPPLDGSQDQQYSSSLGQQYKPPPSQYDAPLGQQYEQPPGSQYDQQQSQQQYDPPSGQEYESQSGQQFAPPMGQQYEQPPGQQYEPQMGQEYETPQGQPFDTMQNQQYEPPPGQQYEPSQDQQYDPQYQQPSGQYQSPVVQQYESQPSQQNEYQPGQQSESQTGQQYESPPGDGYELLPRPNESPQYGPPSRQVYETAPGQQYESIPGQQYEPPLSQQFNPSQIQSSSSSPKQPFQSPILQPSLNHEVPQGQYENRPDQAQHQYDMSLRQQYTSPSNQFREIPTRQSEFQPSPRNEQPISQYKPQLIQPYKKPLVGKTLDQRHPSIPNEDVYSQYQPGKQSPDESIMQFHKQQSNVQTYDQKPLKSYQQTIDKMDSRLQKPLNQMFSQSHDLQDEAHVAPEPQVREETFDQLYSRLHEPSFDLPHELNVPQYSGPPDDGFEDMDHGPDSVNNQPSAVHAATTEQNNVARNDDVRVRPQMPVDYQNDYFFYSRRNGSNL